MSTKLKNEYSIGIRIFHWLNATTIILILFTIFTRKNWLEKFKIRDLILDFANKHQIEISPDSALSLAKIIRNEIWDFHYYLGIFLAFLIIYRIILLAWPDGRRIFKEGFTIFSSKRAKRANIKFMYFVIYLALIIAITTGLMMYFKTELNLTDETDKAMEALHVGIVTLIIYFVPVHILGVLISEFGNERGIISRMINGGKDKNKI